MSRPAPAADRLDTIRRLGAAHDAEAVLVGHPDDVRWAVGFTGSNALLVVTEAEAHLVTDGRYTEQARTEVASAEVHIADGPLVEAVRDWGLLGGAQSAVVQADRLTIAEHQRIEAAFPEADLVPVSELLAASVAAKSEAEVEAVRRAQALTCEVFEAILPSIRVGMSELDLAAEITYQHLKRGASAMSFPPIVASGPRGALPHARPTAKTLAGGELVVIDMGGVLDGYCSDLTRTVAVGDPGEAARDAYAVVERAQHAAIEAAEADRLGGDLDRVARDVIEAAGLGEAFSHSLGHGVGLDVHEWPRLSQKVEHRLPAGATVTIEPGVYLPGRFGIRIEDVIVLREGGAENLTPLPTDLIVL
ncbi:MAG: Xaa-Pro peptidase family protein [Bacteroidota bacterium]